MKQIISILTILFLVSCSSNVDKNTDKYQAISSDKKTEKKKIISETEFIIGERIDGPANVRNSINGKILFTLNDNVLVETTPTKGKWLQIGLFVKLTNKENKDFRILPNTDLISGDGRIIGKTVDTVDVWMGNEESGLIGAYTHIDNIKKQTIPEIILAKKIEENNISKKGLSKFIKDFEFQDYEQDEQPNLKQLFIYESIVEDPSPRDRITLLFDNSEKMIGIVHSRPIITTKYKTYDLVRGHSLTITTDLTEEEITKMINKRIYFYNSID